MTEPSRQPRRRSELTTQEVVLSLGALFLTCTTIVLITWMVMTK